MPDTGACCGLIAPPPLLPPPPLRGRRRRLPLRSRSGPLRRPPPLTYGCRKSVGDDSGLRKGRKCRLAHAPPPHPPSASGSAQAQLREAGPAHVRAPPASHWLRGESPPSPLSSWAWLPHVHTAWYSPDPLRQTVPSWPPPSVVVPPRTQTWHRPGPARLAGPCERTAAPSAFTGPGVNFTMFSYELEPAAPEQPSHQLDSALVVLIKTGSRFQAH